MRNFLAAIAMSVTAGFLAVPISLQAETVMQTEDYIAVGFEAEEYDNKGLRWVRTQSNTAQQEVDPDGNHSSSASGGVYLEVLPDFRVTGEDEFHPSGSLWNAFQGPELTYTINFPEAGRYYAHLRAYSTGSEDNGAHIGINDDFPPQARRIQWCRGKNQWTWSSAQRDSGGNGSCGREKTVYLEVPTAGTHTINVQAREDGYEVDRIVLIKDLSNNTRICEPDGATQISCRDGSIEFADEMIDMRVRLESDVPEAAIGGEVILTAMVENLDPFDHATNVVTTIDVGTGFEYVGDLDECTSTGSVVTCTHADLEPTAPGESEDYVLELLTVGIGALTVTASVSADEVENFPNNDTDSLTLNGLTELPDVDLMVSIASPAATLDVGDETQIIITLTNPDADSANGVQFTYDPPQGASVQGIPSQCTEMHLVTCNLGIVPAGVAQASIIDIAVTEAGTQIHTVAAESNNDPDPSNNSDGVILEVVDPTVLTVAEPEPEPETETEAETDTETDTDDSAESETVTDTDADTDSETEVDSETNDPDQVDGTDGEETGALSGEGDATDADAEADSDSDESDAVDESGSGIGGTTEISAQANAGSESSGGGGGSSGLTSLVALFILLILSMAVSVRFRSDMN